MPKRRRFPLNKPHWQVRWVDLSGSAVEIKDFRIFASAREVFETAEFIRDSVQVSLEEVTNNGDDFEALADKYHPNYDHATETMTRNGEVEVYWHNDSLRVGA